MRGNETDGRPSEADGRVIRRAGWDRRCIRKTQAMHSKDAFRHRFPTSQTRYDGLVTFFSDESKWLCRKKLTFS